MCVSCVGLVLIGSFLNEGKKREIKERKEIEGKEVQERKGVR